MRLQIQLINDYSKWIADGLLKYHADRKQNDKRYKVNESSLDFDMFNFVVAHLGTNNWFYLMSQPQTYWNDERRRRSGPLSEIQKLAKILPTYLDMSGFLDQKVRTYWSTIEAYRDKMANPFDVQYVTGIAQQTIDSMDCGPFVASYAEYLSDGLQVPNDGLDVGLLLKIYAALLWKHGETKAQKPYATDVKDPR
ncbi:hypothetical protein BC332_30046 [Capsicum chinense]|nr:hypothetical protein BC332_30046 [Capsicum chinense]